MTEMDSGGGGGSHYTVHAKKIKNSVIGGEADQRNQHPARVKGSTVLAVVAAAAALAAVVVPAVVLLGGSGDPVAATQAVPSGMPGPPAASPAAQSPAQSPTPSHRASRPPSTTPARPPDTPSSAPDLPPAPGPSVRAPRPPVSSAPPAAPAPQPSTVRPCPLRKEYRLMNRAQLWNAQGEHIGDVASGTLFFRQEAAGYPEPVDDRYYGTVDQAISGSATGYVLRKKLDYVGTVEYCRSAVG
ncbi:hypothetical protein [Streptomyces sp. NPDC049040]|uniref:hypothetical protein n=1 Tax=Streptomyces sp. NPDC049040 TaxID=3365593 RepID=UPI00371E902A